MSSTGHKVNFRLVSNILVVVRKDFTLADLTLAKPLSNPNPLSDGEYMLLDSNGKAIRAAAINAAGNAAARTSYPVWAEEGRWDVQASGGKVPLLWAGEYEYQTRLFDAAAEVGDEGVVIDAMLQPVKVASITINSRIKLGLVGHGGADDPDPVVGIVTGLPAANGGWLQVKKASTW